MELSNCGDCLASEGQLHEEGCDMERCPKCKGQLLSCECNLENLNREPHFNSIFCCERCGKKMPELFMVSDEEWEFICGATYPLSCVLCKRCVEFIRSKRRRVNE